MYGLVNQAIEDLVKTSMGDDAWECVRHTAGFNEPEFIARHNYANEITFRLVGAASELLMESPESLLRLFGRHWIMYTGREGWHDFFDVSCTGVIAFLKQLGDMHEKVRESMPGSKPPTITLIKVIGGYELDYRSERDGLAPMFEGIIEGLAEYYEEPWVIEQVQTKALDGVDRFRLRLVGAVLNSEQNRNAA